MGLVAAQAVLICHELGMGLMADKAVVDFFMITGVTLGTVELGVFAGELFQLFSLIAMAGVAASGYGGAVFNADI